MRTLAFVALTIGCQNNIKPVIGEPDQVVVVTDADADGFSSDEDCDDDNAAINPSSTEICDGLDNDCDGDVDEGVVEVFYLDDDGDGFGDAEISVEGCSAPEGYVINANDCDDEDSESFPGAVELCDEKDNNCDGQVDEGVGETYYVDADQDGYGNLNQPQQSCEPSPGLSEIAGDCNDRNESIHPDAPELCDELDNDCDGDVDEDGLTTFYLDADSDGAGDPDTSEASCSRPAGYVLSADDCDDSNGSINPGATELCDGVDNNCDGSIDEDSAADAMMWYTDGDADGFGAGAGTLACQQPAGMTASNDDCDDSSAAVNPAAAEVCDGQDNDCNGFVDGSDPNLSNGTTYGLDLDSDGYGSSQVTAFDCSPPAGYVSDLSDCDDLQATVNPGATEICDGLDNDCDLMMDDNDPSLDISTRSTFYIDGDGDGYGGATAIDACDQPAGSSANNLDCDDSDASTSPDTVWYLDADGDGYAGGAASQSACLQPLGYFAAPDDCDDLLATVNPGAVEVCDGVDNDCDADVDDDDAGIQYDAGDVWYSDTDGDGYGAAANTVNSCLQPPNTASNADDCDDTLGNIYPGAVETCDGFDEDCDSIVDEDLLGADAFCPAVSCADVLQEEPSSTDGIYWLDPDGAGSFEAYCDMTNGGWTLILKTSGDSTFDYDDPLWTNGSLLNESSLDLSVANSKQTAFVRLPINELRGCVSTQGAQVQWPWSGHCFYGASNTNQTAVGLFSSGSLQFGSGFNGEEYSGWSWQPNCHYYGTNTPFYYFRARFGFTANQENDCNTNDTAIGFGIAPYGFSSSSYRYGSGQICSSTQCSQGNVDNGFPGLLYGR